MGSRNTHLLTPRPFIVDPATIVRSSGRQIDWASIPESFRQGGKATIALTADAAGAATSLTVTVTSLITGTLVIPIGTVLDFGGGKFVRVATTWTTGSTLTVDAIPTAMTTGDSATYFDPGDAGKKKITAGSVVSLVLPTNTVSAAASAGNTGNGTIGTVSATYAAKPGIYKLTCVEPASNLGNWIVEDPNGKVVGDAITASAATVDGVTFTIADGSTDFAVGDGFTIEVITAEASKSGKVVPRSLGKGKSLGILLTEAIEGDVSAGLNGYGVIVGGVLWENNLPDAVSGEIPESYKEELALAGTGFSFERYVDGRTSQALA